jgi:hypothetical protein
VRKGYDDEIKMLAFDSVDVYNPQWDQKGFNIEDTGGDD